MLVMNFWLQNICLVASLSNRIQLQLIEPFLLLAHTHLYLVPMHSLLLSHSLPLLHSSLLLLVLVMVSVGLSAGMVKTKSDTMLLSLS